MFGNADGAGAIINSCCQVIITFSGISAFMAIIALADPLIIAIALIAGIINLFLCLLIAKDEIKFFHALSSNHEKTYYLAWESTDPRPAKDMKIFNMVSWFSPLIDLLMLDKKSY